MTTVTTDSALLYWARKLLEKILDDLQKNFEDMPAELSGEGLLRNVWEEICGQEQTEQSFFYDAYVTTIWGLIEATVEELNPIEVSTLGLLSDDSNLMDEVENQDNLIQNNQICIDIIYQYFIDRATEYENENIERYKWRDEDEEDQLDLFVGQNPDSAITPQSQNKNLFDLDIYTNGMVITVALLERNPKSFIDYSFMIAEDLEVPLIALKPYLRAWYNATRDMLEDQGADVKELQTPEQVQKTMQFSMQLCGEKIAEPDI